MWSNLEIHENCSHIEGCPAIPCDFSDLITMNSTEEEYMDIKKQHMQRWCVVNDPIQCKTTKLKEKNIIFCDDQTPISNECLNNRNSEKIHCMRTSIPSVFFFFCWTLTWILVRAK